MLMAMILPSDQCDGDIAAAAVVDDDNNDDE
jgi:hypothetical protein